MNKPPFTIESLIRKLEKELSSVYEPHELKRVIFYLLEHHFELKQIDMVLQKDRIISQEQFCKVSNSAERLKKNEPLQYITGRAYFLDLILEVDPKVLIPRPETEELVLKAIEQPLPASARILDIGTGSGCIALSIKKKLPDTEVHASENSAGALELARKNAEAYSLNIHFHHWNIVEYGEAEELTYNMIISNPPYVTPAEADTLMSRVSDWEPEAALFTPADDPLYFYRVIAGKALKMLNSSGVLAFETHEDHARETGKMLENLGYKEVTLYHDMNGKNRFVFAYLQHQKTKKMRNS